MGLGLNLQGKDKLKGTKIKIHDFRKSARSFLMSVIFSWQVSYAGNDGDNHFVRNAKENREVGGPSTLAAIRICVKSCFAVVSGLWNDS